MTTSFYTILNGFCICILLLLALNRRRSATKLPDERFFHYVLISTVVVLALDAFGWWIDKKVFYGSRVLSIISNTGMYILLCFVGMVWLFYADYKIFVDERSLEKRGVIYLIPFCLYTITALISCFTGWLFSVDENNVYTHGDFHFVHMIIIFGYMLVGVGYAVRVHLRSGDKEKRKQCRYIIFFTLLLVICSIIQTLNYGLSLMLPCLTYSLLVVFINMQNGQISVDALTKINNRGTLNRYLASTVNDLKNNEILYLMLIDVDDFKSINDRFGHVEGDRALINVADILKRTCGRLNERVFLARFGGDEFALVFKELDAGTVKRVTDALLVEVEISNMSQEDLKLSVSYGIAEFNRDTMKTLDELITRADAEMYKNKLKRK